MDPHDIHYPLPELTTAFGFFMLLFVDRFVTLAGRVCQGNVCSNKGAQSTVESNGIGINKKHMIVVSFQYLIFIGLYCIFGIFIMHYNAPKCYGNLKHEHYVTFHLLRSVLYIFHDSENLKHENVLRI